MSYGARRRLSGPGPSRSSRSEAAGPRNTGARGAVASAVGGFKPTPACWTQRAPSGFAAWWAAPGLSLTVGKRRGLPLPTRCLSHQGPGAGAGTVGRQPGRRPHGTLVGTRTKSCSCLGPVLPPKGLRPWGKRALGTSTFSSVKREHLGHILPFADDRAQVKLEFKKRERGDMTVHNGKFQG